MTSKPRLKQAPNKPKRTNATREAAARTIQRAWKRQLSANTNMISLSRYPRKYAVKKGPQSFNARQLVELIKRGNTRWPHSREPMTNAEQRKIHARAGAVRPAPAPRPEHPPGRIPDYQELLRQMNNLQARQRRLAQRLQGRQ